MAEYSSGGTYGNSYTSAGGYQPSEPYSSVTVDQIPLARPTYPTTRPQHPSYNHIYHPVNNSTTVHGDDQDCLFFLKNCMRLLLFHILNAMLGFVSFTLVVSGTSLSISLLPLCCLGLLVFRVVVYMVQFLAQADVVLYNYISLPEKRVLVNKIKTEEIGVNNIFAGERLSRSLESFSPFAVMTTIYFAMIKFGIAWLSFFSVALCISLPVALCSSFFVGSSSHTGRLLSPTVQEFHTDPIGSAFESTCIVLLGIASMHLVSKLSREATRFFCCERFARYQYLHGNSNMNTIPTYGTTTSNNYMTV